MPAYYIFLYLFINNQAKKNGLRRSPPATPQPIHSDVAQRNLLQHPPVGHRNRPPELMKSAGMIVMAAGLAEGAPGPIQDIVEWGQNLDEPDLARRFDQPKSASDTPRRLEQADANRVPQDPREVMRRNTGLRGDLLREDRFLA